ncbi:MAG: apolipoprotein N-acyltransferase, partial [Bacteroidota bacterium]|nr:apolipoprotein N-acyltransferase [Bacteroidota bacterium]
CSFSPFPVPFQLLLLFGLIPYLFVIEKKKSLLDINRSTYLFAFTFSLITLYWVGSWQKNADPFLMISGVLLAFVNPVFFLIPSTLYFYSRKVVSEKLAIYLLPLFWVTYEYMYMATEAAFPWLTLGNGLAKFTVLIQLADIIGAVGLSLLIVLINVLFYKAYKFYYINKPSAYLNFFGALFIISLWAGYGFSKITNYKPADKTLKIGIVQPDLDPWDKWSGSNLFATLNLYTTLSEQAVNKNAKLILWPETALPVYLLSGNYTSVVDSIYSYIHRRNIFLLTGMPHFVLHPDKNNHPADAKYSKGSDYYYSTYNAVMLFSPYSSDIPFYGKARLVPFGERVPFASSIPFLADLVKWGVGISGWNIGRDTTIFTVSAGNTTAKISGLVCYESIFPYFLDRFAKKGAELFVVVTNDSWYGNSSGPRQHFDFSSLRAVEYRRSVVHVANGGISGIIDPLGKPVVKSKMFEQSVITEDVTLNSDMTIFAKHPMAIPILCGAFSVWIAGMYLLMYLKRKFNL